MVKYDVKTLFDFIDAFADISTKKDNDNDDKEYEINLLNDIDFNDEQYSEYWVNKKSILKTSIYIQKMIINIRGNGFTLKNMYIVNGHIFDIYISGGHDFKINFYNLTIEAVFNKNFIRHSADGIGIQKISYYTSTTTYQAYINCTFNIKMYNSKVSDGNSYTTLKEGLFQAYNDYPYNTFTSCIFNIEYYRLHPNIKYSDFCIFTNEADRNYFYNKKTIFEYSQFYIKLYLCEKTTDTGTTNVNALIQQACIDNCFFVFDIMIKNSSTPLNIFYNNNCFNTYFLLRDKSNNQRSIEIQYNYNNYSSENNWFHTESIGDTTSGMTLIDTSGLSEIKFTQVSDNANAKDAAWLVDNIGFIVKV